MCTGNVFKPTAYSSRRKLRAQSDDNDVGPAAIAARSDSGWSAGGERDGGGFPYPQHCELSSHLALERERGKVWDEDIKEKRAIYSASSFWGYSNTAVGK